PEPFLAVKSVRGPHEDRAGAQLVSYLFPIHPVLCLPHVTEHLPVNDAATNQRDCVLKYDSRRISSCTPRRFLCDTTPLHSVTRVPNVVVILLSVKPAHQPYFLVEDYGAVEDSGRQL